MTRFPNTASMAGESKAFTDYND